MEDALTTTSQHACRFCQIIRGEIPSAIVFEDETSLAILDTRPLFPRHCLLVPKAHVETQVDLSAVQVAPLFQNAQRIEEPLPGGGTFIAINNRVSQSVPRHKKDGLKGFFWPRKPYKDQETMQRIQTLLHFALMRS
jgi:histidine triad (HIT) family protein